MINHDGIIEKIYDVLKKLDELNTKDNNSHCDNCLFAHSEYCGNCCYHYEFDRRLKEIAEKSGKKPYYISNKGYVLELQEALEKQGYNIGIEELLSIKLKDDELKMMKIRQTPCFDCEIDYTVNCNGTCAKIREQERRLIDKDEFISHIKETYCNHCNDSWDGLKCNKTCEFGDMIQEIESFAEVDKNISERTDENG